MLRKERMNLKQLFEEDRQFFQRNLIWSVGKSARRLRMSLHEDSVATGGCSGAREHRRENAVPAAAITRASRSLN
jgi:hypothetical protein